MAVLKAAIKITIVVQRSKMFLNKRWRTDLKNQIILLCENFTSRFSLRLFMAGTVGACYNELNAYLPDIDFRHM
jgi:hypothetical protein